MLTRQVYFTRQETEALKGIALIFMFVHHFFTFPSWWGNTVSYPVWAALAPYLCMPFKSCVSMYAFLTGYLYWHASAKNYRYSIRKSTDILISYWLAFALLGGVAVLSCGFRPDGMSLLRELFGIQRQVMAFCWYIYFYLFVMLVLPVLGGRVSDSGTLLVLLGMILPAILGEKLPEQLTDPYHLEMTAGIAYYLPVVTAGLLAARFDLLGRAEARVNAVLRHKGLRVCLWLALGSLAFMGRYLVPELTGRFTVHLVRDYYPWSLRLNLDVLYAPLLVLSLTQLLRELPLPPLEKLLGMIGRHSMSMWFVSCLFFAERTAETFRSWLYWPRYSLLVLLWGTALCYLAAWALDSLAAPLLKAKNRILQ